MKVTIEIPDITTACCALNNAMLAYGNAIRSIMLGCEVPKVLEPLKQLDDHYLKQRYDCIADIYKQLEEMERKTAQKNKKIQYKIIDKAQKGGV